jgi:hypothetical protein
MWVLNIVWNATNTGLNDKSFYCDGFFIPERRLSDRDVAKAASS